MKFEQSAGVVLYKIAASQEPEYLVLHYVPGHWDFPKGKIEAGETLVQTALRETKEETGLDATIDDAFQQKISYFFKDRSGQLVNKEVIFFVGTTTGTDVTLSREHVGYQWLTLDAALNQLTFQNAKQLLRLADQYIRTNHLPKKNRTAPER
jgi:bis(5'-nucleosidyl)-tetraphosphatase